MPQTRPLKVLFLAYGLVDSRTDGRITTATYLATALSQKTRVAFLSTGPKPERFTRQGVLYELVKTGDGFGFLRSLSALRRLFSSFKPDVVHYHPPAGFNTINVAYLFLLSFFCRLHGVKFVVYLWGGPVQALFWKRFFSRIITPTHEPGFDFIPPVVDPRRFHPSRKRKTLLPPRARGKKNVLFMTGARHFSPEIFQYLLHVRGLADVVSAANKLPDRVFVVSVPCLEEGAGRRAFDAYLAAHGKPGNVLVVGEADAPALLATADAYVFPYQCEEPLFLPVSLVESFASGTPVVGTDLAFMRRVIAAGNTGLLYPPGDADALAFALTTFDRPAFRRGIVRRARAEAARYAPKHVLGRHLAVLKSVCR